ncbi:hypothetical protein K458DRAFT_424257 [Lentithecium fluviatile CBS 122367]|uniref:Xylanolytic transcriptional activator regulatory domain-containing protein n=1 Tax=Lentithecium fluviatile CBS 122367 TaxID=1168545 RepID=A0A6G1IGP2_9PLEO|nr:hypothetical protein K458DRAFT_424257 [Lentithecium fluviatile CBS 122367]
MQCRNCIEQGVTCVYSLARRDRFKEVTAKNAQLVALLKNLSSHVDDHGLRMIGKHLEALGDDPDEGPTAVSETLGKHSRESTPSDAGTDASDNSDDDTDPLDEDLLRNRESRATGFIGSNSSVQWLRSLKTRIGTEGGTAIDNPHSLPYRPSNTNVIAGLGHPASHSQYSGRQSQRPSSLRVSSSTFYLDDDDLQLDVMVDPYELPPPETAERLFDNYMKTIHASFPILPDAFDEQFRRWNESRQTDRNYQIPEEWQAVLNLVLAIGAQYSHLIQAEGRAAERDDLIYMTRANRILRLDKLATSLPAPSLTFIQATGLLSLYYLTIGQVSRAWMMVGISLRFALAAGLHLRNDDPSALLNKKETLVRTWWSLHSIESLLCAIIGRPCIIPNDECTVPLPQIAPKMSSHSDSSNSQKSTHSSSRGDSDTVTRSSFLGARVTIALILQKALAKLYSPQLSVDSWDRVQNDITALLREIEEWHLAARLAGLSPASSLEESGIERAKLVLSFHYWSAKLLICRPCLCRIERRNKGQSDTSADFYQRTADTCVQSAQAITRLLPDQLDLRFVYQQCPWWCIIHNIMQAIAVFMLKMSLGRRHMIHDGEDLSESVKKLARWLRCLSASNDVADRAYQVILELIRSSAPRIHIDISDIASENPTSALKVETTGSGPSFSSPTSPDPAFSPHQPPQSQSQRSYPVALSPHSFGQQNIWSPQEAYTTTAPTTVSPNPATQISSPQDAYTSTATTHTSIAHNTRFTSPQLDQQSTKQNMNPQSQPPSQPQPQPDIPPQPQYPTHQPFDAYPFDTDFAMGGDLQMQSFFGNPFLTNFDQADVLAGMFGGAGEFGQRQDMAGRGGESNMQGMETGGEYSLGVSEEFGQGGSGEFGQGTGGGEYR